MPILLWDASALAKRYVEELGTETVHAIFGQPSVSSMIFTCAGYRESHAILRRRFNAGQVSATRHGEARVLIRLEVIESLCLHFIEAETMVFDAIPLIDRHNLNATDAMILAAYLDFHASLSPNDPPCVLLASDHRLLRAAQADLRPVIDSEMMAAQGVPAFLNAL